MKKINAILTISRRALKRNPMIPPMSRSIAIIPVGMIPLSVSISIPITSTRVTACLLILSIICSFMNNPIGMCFPDFIGLRPLGLPFCARPGRKKYRSAARMIFSCPAKPLRAALRQKAGNPRSLPLKSGKTDSFLYGHKKCRPFGLHSYGYIDMDVILLLWNRC